MRDDGRGILALDLLREHADFRFRAAQEFVGVEIVAAVGLADRPPQFFFRRTSEKPKNGRNCAMVPAPASPAPMPLAVGLLGGMIVLVPVLVPLPVVVPPDRGPGGLASLVAISAGRSCCRCRARPPR